jgi:hypothetical protein
MEQKQTIFGVQLIDQSLSFTSLPDDIKLTACSLAHLMSSFETSQFICHRQDWKRIFKKSKNKKLLKFT